MKVRIALIILLLAIHPAYSAFDYPAFSPRHAALANSVLAGKGIGDGFVLNPALAVNAAAFYGALNYSQLFDLKELRYTNGLIGLPLNGLGLGVSIEDFGGSLYREDKLSFAVARLWYGGKLALGISVHWYHVSAKNYESINSLGISVGFRYQVTSHLSAAGVVDNVNQPRLNGFSEQIPQRISMGLFYRVSDDMDTYIAVQKDSWYSPELSMGVEYRLLRGLRIMTGYSTLASVPTAGLELKSANIKIGYSLQYHFELGITHFVGIAYAPGR